LLSSVINGMLTSTKPSDFWTINPSKCFAELAKAKTTQQRNGQSVFNHTMNVLDSLSLKSETTLLAALFHDLGKTEICVTFDQSKFPNHALLSARIVRRRLSSWQSSQELIDKISRLVNTHMFDITIPLSHKTISKFVADVGRHNIDAWFILREADSVAYHNHSIYCQQFIKPFKIKIKNYLNQLPGTIKFPSGDANTDVSINLDGK